MNLYINFNFTLVSLKSQVLELVIQIKVDQKKQNDIQNAARNRKQPDIPALQRMSLIAIARHHFRLQIIFFEVGKFYPAQRINYEKAQRQRKKKNADSDLVAGVEQLSVALVDEFVKKENAEPENRIQGNANP
jgi:hypothetical protein